MPDTHPQPIHLCVPFGWCSSEWADGPTVALLDVTPDLVARLRELAQTAAAMKLDYMVDSIAADAVDNLPEGVDDDLDHPFVITDAQAEQIAPSNGISPFLTFHIRGMRAYVDKDEWFIRCYDKRNDVIFETILLPIPPADVLSLASFSWTSDAQTAVECA